MTKLKTIRIIAECALIVVMGALAVAVGAKNSKLSVLKEQNRILTEEVDSLRSDNLKLGSLEGINVTVEYTVKSTNVLGITTNIPTFTAREVAVLTRKELLDSLKNNR